MIYLYIIHTLHGNGLQSLLSLHCNGPSRMIKYVLKCQDGLSFSQCKKDAIIGTRQPRRCQRPLATLALISLAYLTYFLDLADEGQIEQNIIILPCHL